MQPIQASQFEGLFEEHLHLYDSDLEALAQERQDQEQVAAQVREGSQAFARARKGDASTKERERALQELENGYLRYKELTANIEVGRKFYNDLAKIVGRFRDDCRAFVHQRRVEASQMEAWVAPLTAAAICSTPANADPLLQRHCQRRGNGFADHVGPAASPVQSTPASPPPVSRPAISRPPVSRPPIDCPPISRSPPTNCAAANPGAGRAAARVDDNARGLGARARHPVRRACSGACPDGDDCVCCRRRHGQRTAAAAAAGRAVGSVARSALLLVLHDGVHDGPVGI